MFCLFVSLFVCVCVCVRVRVCVCMCMCMRVCERKLVYECIIRAQ